MLGVDLLDRYRGRLTWRRLWVLVSQLPADSRFRLAERVLAERVAEQATEQAYTDRLAAMQRRKRGGTVIT